MGLDEAVRIGRFCGLHSVEECINNVRLHASSLFRYSSIGKELEQLHEDYDLYLDGHYKLDIEKIDIENQAEMDKWLDQEHHEENVNDDQYDSLELSFIK